MASGLQSLILLPVCSNQADAFAVLKRRWTGVPFFPRTLPDRRHAWRLDDPACRRTRGRTVEPHELLGAICKQRSTNGTSYDDMFPDWAIDHVRYIFWTYFGLPWVCPTIALPIFVLAM